VKLQEAYSVLDLPETSSPEEAKKKYRELTKLWHPDVNKSPEAEAKFKKINEAYQVVSSGKSSDREDQWPTSAPFNPFSHFANFGSQRMYDGSPISVNLTISFLESVVGCEKEVKFNRLSKCTNCQGAGEYTQHNGCTACNGKGQVIQQNGGIIRIQNCPKCGGKVQKSSCGSCKAVGVIQMEASARVSIPGGVTNNDTLRLGGIGNYIGSFGPLEQHSDVHLHVKVTPQAGLSLEGTQVICTLELSLQEALQGCKKIVNSIDGFREIEVPPRARNKDEVIIPRLGVNRTGNQRIILDVKYPEDISQIIEVLNTSLNYKVN
jgi:molecular chaperone DnaJ